jgi:hypothetical protein
MTTENINIELQRSVEVLEAGFIPWLGRNARHLGNMAIDPNRPVSGALATAFIQHLDDPRMAMLLRDAYLLRPERDADETQRMLFSSFSHSMRQTHGPTFVADLCDNTASSAQALESLLSDTRQFQVFQRKYIDGHLSTTVPERYGFLKFLVQVAAHKLGPTIRRFDIGGGPEALGDKKILSNDPIDPIEVVDRTTKGLVVSKEKSDIYNEIVALPSVETQVVNVDQDTNSEEVWQWVSSCYTLEEQLEGKVPARNEALRRLQLDSTKLLFHRADVLSPEEVKTLVYEIGQAAVVSAVMSMYQIAPKLSHVELSTLLDSLVTPNGIFACIDFMKATKDGMKLAPHRRWHHPDILVRSNGKFDLVARYTSGRAKQIMFFSALWGLAEGGPYEKEVKALLT